ncbi:MAG: type II toxin-antitoxin system VapC family toxin [Candidatus Dormibacteria bacterium]
MLIVDAGPLYAAAARRDRHHARCVELLRRATGPLIVPALVVTEVAYLLGDRIGPHAETAFARSIASGELQVEPVVLVDWARIASLTAEYADMALGMVDASVVALAERLGATTIASLDHRHLLAVRPNHVSSFQLVP